MGCEEVMEMERKLAKSLSESEELVKKIRWLKRSQKSQGKELEKIVVAKEHECKIRFMNESLKQLKSRAKELEDKLAVATTANVKTKDYLDSIKHRYAELRSKQLANTSSAQKQASLELAIERETIKDSSDLKDKLKELKLSLERQRSDVKREAEMMASSMQALSKRTKELELTNRLNALQLKQLARVDRGVHVRKKVLVERKCRMNHREKFSLLRSHRSRARNASVCFIVQA